MGELDLNSLVELCRIKTMDGDFVVHSDSSRLVAYLSGVRLNPELTIERLKELLESKDIVFGLHKEGLEEIVACASENKPAKLVLVAEGTQVVEGEDAHLDFKKLPAGSRADFSGDDTKVDYKEANVFDNVKEGDLIATLIPLKEGQGGVDIFDKV
ncbi:MAG: DUF342 domain-containing protein, partial [Planctomycetes bacterium]|nr:DUF342 domain-containing protein [Planctomycetota bacterium]